MTLTPCTIICRNYIAQASVFVDSFRAVYPDADCVVMIVDGTEADRDTSGAFRVVLPSDLALPDFETMAGEYEPIELSTAVKPWLLDWMLDEYGTAGPIAYFDPDIQVVTPLVELEEMLRDYWCALTPHLNDPMPLDGLEPTEHSSLISATSTSSRASSTASAFCDMTGITWPTGTLQRDRLQAMKATSGSTIFR